MLYMHQLWDFRSFILGSVRREFQARYRSSLLGSAWVILPALAQIIIYTVVFSRLIGARLPGVDDTMGYSIYLCAGIIAWSLHSELISRNTSVFLDNANMIKKLQFPRICLPVIIVTGAVINFFVITAIFLISLLVMGKFPGVVLLALIPLLAVHAVLSASIGIALGVINVFFRDMGQFSQILLQFWFWLTPIVYPASILPDKVSNLVALNPMAPLVAAYQQIFLYSSWPNWGSIIPVVVVAFMLLVGALLLYRKNVADMVDEL